MEIKTKLDFDYRGIGKIFDDLEKAETFAVKRTLSRTAFNTMEDARDIADRKLILRNSFSKRNIVYQNTTGSTIADMESKAGATKRAEHLAFQEEGGKRTGKGGSDMMVPTDQARTGKSKKKLVSKRNYREIYGVISGGKKADGTYRSNLVAAAFIAWRNKLLMPYRDGLFRIRKLRKSKDGIKFEMDELYKKENYTITKPREWLQPAANMNAEKMQDVYNEEMDKSVDRWIKGKF